MHVLVQTSDVLINLRNPFAHSALPGWPTIPSGRASLVLGYLERPRHRQSMFEKARALHLLGSISGRPERLDVNQSNSYFVRSHWCSPSHAACAP